MHDATMTTSDLELAELREQTLVLEKKLKAALRENELLRERLARFLRRTFGPKAEHLDPGQLLIGFEDLVEIAAAQAQEPAPPHALEAADEEEGTSAPPKRKGAHGRRPLPKDLPRIRVEHHPALEDRVCGGCKAPLQPIGTEVSEEMDWQPATLTVTEHVRVKYACKTCQEGVTIAPLPPRPIEKGRPGTGLLAHVLVSKYADHLPLARLEGIFERSGVEISRSTMCDWIGGCARLLSPVWAELKKSVLSSSVLHADDTPVLCQENSRKGQPRQGYLWAWVGEQAEVVYDFTLSHAQTEPSAFLGEWKGFLQSDASSSFNEIHASGAVIEVGCWAHTRRGFFDALKSDAERASRMLALIQLLYKVERQGKERGLDPPALARLRQEQARPLLERIRQLLDQYLTDLVPKSPLGEATIYLRNQWAALNRYVEDGRLSIDNNPAERALRAVAVGRKNWLFTGSPEGGKRAAVIYSFITTCKLQAVEPFGYLRDVLERRCADPEGDCAKLMPRAWKAARATQAPS